MEQLVHGVPAPEAVFDRHGARADGAVTGHKSVHQKAATGPLFFVSVSGQRAGPGTRFFALMNTVYLHRRKSNHA